MQRVAVLIGAVGAATLLIALTAFSATPRLVNYQGLLTDSAGNPLDGSYLITFTIYDGQMSGSDSLWGEMQTVEVTNGLFNVLLGSVTPLTDDIFSDTGRYLGIMIGITEPEIAPRTPLVSAPYAFRVQTVDGATGGDVYGNLTLHSVINVGDAAGEAGYIKLYNGADQTIQISGKYGTDNGSLVRLDNGDGDPAIILEADDYQVGDVGGVIRLTDGVFPDTTVTLDAWDVGGGALVTMGNSEGDATIILDARDAQEASDIGARVTLLNGSSEAIILNAIDVSTSFGPQFIMKVGNDTTVSIYANGDYGDGGGIIRLYDDDATKTVHVDANGATYGGAQVSLSDHDGTTTISLDAESGSGGGAFVSMYDSIGTKTIHIDANGTSGGAQVSLIDHDSTTTISLDAESGVNGGANVVLQTGAGVQTIRLDADYGGTGEGRVITTVLEITGGADLSEQFDIGDYETKARPGMLVCIDPLHAGELAVSSRAYDPTVAGIISGAGGIKPGMLMGQSGTVSDGQFAVALTGRVYCRADASYGPIRPGDLLTTSNTPGHAMKVTDYAMAQGAIIGKAMSALDEGTGLVLILVSLQ